MTDPTPKLYADLSPAAQKVLDAMRRSYDHEPTRRALAAAVLRAVAHRTTAGILTIANELDPQP